MVPATTRKAASFAANYSSLQEFRYYHASNAPVLSKWRGSTGFPRLHAFPGAFQLLKAVEMVSWRGNIIYSIAMLQQRSSPTPTAAALPPQQTS